MCPHVYSTESGARSRHTTHSLEAASPVVDVSSVTGATTAAGVDDVVSRILPRDRRTGTGGGVDGRLRRGVLWADTCLLTAVIWLLGTGIRGGGRDNCSRGASIEVTLELAAGSISGVLRRRLSDSWLSYAGWMTTWVFSWPLTAELLSARADEDIVWWGWCRWWWWQVVRDSEDLVSGADSDSLSEATLFVTAGTAEWWQRVFPRDAWITSGVITTPEYTHTYTKCSLKQQITSRRSFSSCYVQCAIELKQATILYVVNCDG